MSSSRPLWTSTPGWPKVNPRVCQTKNAQIALRVGALCHCISCAHIVVYLPHLQPTARLNRLRFHYNLPLTVAIIINSPAKAAPLSFLLITQSPGKSAVSGLLSLRPLQKSPTRAGPVPVQATIQTLATRLSEFSKRILTVLQSPTLSAVPPVSCFAFVTGVPDTRPHKSALTF